jgi:PAS domain S-box-containing protein
VYHRFVNPKLGGATLGLERDTSRIIHRVTLFIGLRGSLAADPTARILHVLLVTLSAWLAAGWIATIPFAPVSFPRIFNTVVLEASYVTALVLLRLGHFRRASLAYLAGTWIWATLVCSFFGGVRSPGALLYVSLPASAAWLLGYEAAIWTAGGCIFSGLVFMVLEMTHVGHPLQRQSTPLGIWAMIVQAVVINAIPVGQIIGRLRESQRRLVSIYNTVEDAIFHLAVEPEGQFRIISVNAAFLRLTGLNQEEVLGKTVNEVIPQSSLPMVLRKYRQAIEEKTIVRWEETSDYPAGRLTGEVNVTPVCDNTGTCTHLVGSVHDITGIKRAAQIENRLTSDLEHSRDEIRALAAGLMRAQEDERRRISRELHDQICHQLASLAIEIGELAVSPLPPEKMRVHIEAIRGRVVKTSQETHHIAYRMHTAILDDLGLAASLKDLFRQFSERYPDIALDFEDNSLAASIPREVASCLYRVAQEGLQNIAKHSNAKSVSVRLDFRQQAIMLTIHDDGAGFDRPSVKGHGGLGLISMEERARSVNGKLTITSLPVHGTKISLEVPLPVDNL